MLDCDDGFKFLIFAHHQVVLDGVESLLKKERVGYFRLDGSLAAQFLWCCVTMLFSCIRRKV